MYTTLCVCHIQSMTHTVIELEGLTKRYGDHVVLDRVDLRVGSGILALLGPNGAGKTTLVDVLSTLVRPTAGRPGCSGTTS